MADLHGVRGVERHATLGTRSISVFLLPSVARKGADEHLLPIAVPTSGQRPHTQS